MSVKKIMIMFLGLCLGQIALAAPGTYDGGSRSKPLPGVITVKLVPVLGRTLTTGAVAQQTFGLSAVDGILSRHGGLSVRRTFPQQQPPTRPGVPDLSLIHTVRVTPGNEDALVRELAQSPYVEYTERIFPAYTDATPNDSLYLAGRQGHFNRIAAALAWEIETGSDAIIVAIIDTGVDWDHEDLTGNIWQNLGEDADGDGHTIEWVNGRWILDPGDIEPEGQEQDNDGNGYFNDLIGWDFVDLTPYPQFDLPHAGEDGYGEDNDPSDFDGHGTHCAGIASAVTDNLTGIAGTGWNTTIMPVRVGYQTVDGDGTIPWGYEGIVYAVANGAHIVSLSWGGSGASKKGKDVIEAAWAEGVIIIAAAGNDGSTAQHYPAAYDHVLAVGATSSLTDAVTSFSNYGTWTHIFAPGNAILSTLPMEHKDGPYHAMGGTSMSTPMVAGAAALVRARFPSDNNHEVLMRLAAGAEDIEGSNLDKAGLLGYGRMNMYQSLTEAATPGPDLAIASAFSDLTGGNDDGILDPGEEIELDITFQNQFLGGPASGLTMVLRTGDYAVNLIDMTSAVAGTIDPLGSGLTSTPFTFSIEATSIPHRAVFELDVTGDGYERTYTFSTPIGKAPLLLVDDDDGGNNVESYYFHALDSLGLPFVYWSHDAQGTPVDELAKYGNVVWLTEWAFPALDADDRAALTGYLSGGGNLFMSGQDIGWDLCDSEPHSTPNEYDKSGGASLTWYEANLHARYLADDATPNGEADVYVTGLSGNAIGDGLAFDISQPGRDADNQYPSVIEPLTGAEAIFQYPDGDYAATMWAGEVGDSKVVNFAFGFEAIPTATDRFITMGRVLGWLNEFEVAHRPLTDTEDTLAARSVIATVTSGSSMAVYWSLTGMVPFNIAPMTEGLPGVYTGELPAQENGTTVHYFVYSQADNSYFATSPAGAPYTQHSYYVGPDLVSPVVADLTAGVATIDNSGRYAVQASVSDNGGLDIGSVYLHFKLNSTAYDSLLMAWHDDDVFVDTLDFGKALQDGDTVRYYVSVADQAALVNRTQSDVQEMIIVPGLVIEDFETDIEDWHINRGWEPYGWPHDGEFAITETPTGFYENDSEYILEWKGEFNLTQRESAYVTFWQICILGDNDTALVELTTDGQNWTRGKYFVGTTGYEWKPIAVSLGDYMGRDSVRFRFRLISDDTPTAADGWYIDDISVLADTIILAVDTPVRGLPLHYALKQNYPNPFNPTTIIEYQLPRADDVRITLYNLLGQRVRELVRGPQPAGVHAIQLNGHNLASGVYFYRMEATGFSQTRKLLILK